MCFGGLRERIFSTWTWGKGQHHSKWGEQIVAETLSAGNFSNQWESGRMSREGPKPPDGRLFVLAGRFRNNCNILRYGSTENKGSWTSSTGAGRSSVRGLLRDFLFILMRSGTS